MAKSVSCHICYDKGFVSKCYFCGKKAKPKPRKYKTNEQLCREKGFKDRVEWLRMLWQQCHNLNFKTTGDPALDKEIKRVHGDWL